MRRPRYFFKLCPLIKGRSNLRAASRWETFNCLVGAWVSGPRAGVFGMENVDRELQIDGVFGDGRGAGILARTQGGRRSGHGIASASKIGGYHQSLDRWKMQ